MIRRGKAALLRRIRGARLADGPAPVNLSARDISPDILRTDVDYGMQIVRCFANWAKDAGFSLAGSRVMELGPGINLAGSLGLRALGASEVLAADRWLPPWQRDYNPVFCRMMAKRIRSEEPGWDASVFEQAARRGYAGLVRLIARPAEELASDDFKPVDAVFSNAVLEHMADHRRAIRTLAMITRTGGYGFHQVDFRFHADFNHPLDHLLIPAEEFVAESATRSYELGCQLRPFELEEFFDEAGFEVEMLKGGIAEADYFREFLSRLRASASPYRDVAEERLRLTDAFYVLRKR
jgi:hypothetical protein